MQGYPYHDKLPFCHWSLKTLDPTPHLPLVATRSIAWSVYPSVLYINPNTSPKELQLSSLGYFPSLRDEPLVILTRPVVTRASHSSFHSYHSCPPSGPITSGLASWLHHLRSPCLLIFVSLIIWNHFSHHLIIVYTQSAVMLLQSGHRSSGLTSSSPYKSV